MSKDHHEPPRPPIVLDRPIRVLSPGAKIDRALRALRELDQEQLDAVHRCLERNSRMERQTHD